MTAPPPEDLGQPMRNSGTDQALRRLKAFYRWGVETLIRLRIKLGWFGIRLGYVARRLWQILRVGVPWMFRSREITNFTYDITDRNKLHIAHAVAFVAGESQSRVLGYIRELENDEALRDIIATRVASASFRETADARMGYGRRFAWYAFVRATKPRVVIETGIDKGLGAILLCAALLRNRDEGHPGHYYGTDIAPDAGYLLAPPYAGMGEILYGDSIESLTNLECMIDLFINDSDHSADYERREYLCIKSKLAPNCIILGDNAHATDQLAKFSEAEGRKFVFIPEMPKDHWYPGAGIGVSFV